MPPPAAGHGSVGAPISQVGGSSSSITPAPDLQTLGRDIYTSVVVCRTTLKQCFDGGLLEEVCAPKGDSVFKLMQWTGDAVLSLKMRQLVQQRRFSSDYTEIATVAHQATGFAALGELCDLVGFPAILNMRKTLSRKQRADLVEAVVFKLDVLETEGMRGAHSTLVKTAMSSIMNALFNIGRRRAVREPFAPRPGEVLEQHRSWLRSFAAKDRADPYTHSSLFGGKDWVTDTGRLLFPDTPEVYDQLNRVVVAMHRLGKPLCWVEMATQRYPFFEDIDVMGASASGPPAGLLGMDFWLLRAKVLLAMYDTQPHLDLTLYTAHGYQKEKDCHKASFHAVWSNIVVDKTRAAFLRLATIREFDKESSSGSGGMAVTRQRLLDADERNVWEAVFDQASVFGGSFRMPFCDKVHKGSLEGRQILPEAVYRFEKINGVLTHRVLHQKDGLSPEQWAQRGRVRLQPDPVSMELPPLTPWKMPSGFTLRQTRPSKGVGGSCSGSMGRLAERNRSRDQKTVELWELEQRTRRRVWRGCALAFKRRVDEFMGDAEGSESTWTEIQAKAGSRRWTWANMRLKGAIEIQEPSGEVFLRGSTENQVVLLDMVRQFTEEWDGPIPKLKGKCKKNLLDKGKGKAKCGGKGKGKEVVKGGGSRGGAFKTRWLSTCVLTAARKR